MFISFFFRFDRPFFGPAAALNTNYGGTPVAAETSKHPATLSTNCQSDAATCLKPLLNVNISFRIRNFHTLLIKELLYLIGYI